MRGIYEEFARRGPEQAREVNETLFGLENGIKVQSGRRLALVEPAFFGSKIAEERRLRDAVANEPGAAGRRFGLDRDRARPSAARERRAA